MPPRRVALWLLLLGTWVQAASVGAPAPTLPANVKGEVVLVNFWASWCAPCQRELPELNNLAKEFAGKKVRIIAMNVDEKKANGQKALAHLGLAQPALDVLWDTKSKAVSAWDIQAMPSSFIVDAQGVIRFSHAGFHPQDPASWRSEIRSLLN